jgi:hypothetical protein
MISLLLRGGVDFGDDFFEHLVLQPDALEFLTAVFTGFVVACDPAGDRFVRRCERELSRWSVEAGQFIRLELRC